MLHPVRDLRAFLSGKWRIARRIDDARQGLLGRFIGHGRFAPAPQGLIYDESGRLRFGDYCGEASRRYLFSCDGPDAAMVQHADGRLFHPLNLSTGKDDIEHPCGEDRYRGRYRILGRDAFVVSWHVTGPRKNYHMATRFTRADLSVVAPDGVA